MFIVQGSTAEQEKKSVLSNLHSYIYWISGFNVIHYVSCSAIITKSNWEVSGYVASKHPTFALSYCSPGATPKRWSLFNNLSSICSGLRRQENKCFSLASRHLWASTISLISCWNRKGIKFIPISLILILLHHLANYSHVNTQRFRHLYLAELRVHQFKRKMTSSMLVTMVTWLKLCHHLSHFAVWNVIIYVNFFHVLFSSSCYFSGCSVKIKIIFFCLIKHISETKLLSVHLCSWTKLKEMLSQSICYLMLSILKEKQSIKKWLL